MENEFSQYTSVVREMLEVKKHELAPYIIGENIESEWESHDNWNGGIDFYHLLIHIPVRQFTIWKDNLKISEYEGIISECYNSAMRGSSGSVQLTGISLVPTSSETFSMRPNVDSSMWKDGYFRLFISHLTDNKSSASNLKKCLRKFGIDCFVAHEDIDVTKEWEIEIENALFSMDALCAIIVPDFVNSKWCDQEVGIALGQHKLVIPIAKDKFPYGFLEKYQALKSSNKKANEIAFDIWAIIRNNPKTKHPYYDKFISLILNASTTKDALAKIELLTTCDNLESEIIEQLHNQYKNTPVLNDKAVMTKVNSLFSQYSLPEVKAQVLTEVISDDELPF